MLFKKTNVCFILESYYGSISLFISNGFVLEKKKPFFERSLLFYQMVILLLFLKLSSTDP
jgi:hypothetical protein